MPRENGGIVGIKATATQNYAAGVFTAKTQFINNQAAMWPRSGSVFLAVAHIGSPFFSVYPFSSLGFGSRLSIPASLPASTGNAVKFSPDGKMIAVGHETTPFITAYPFSSSGIGTKYSNPGSVPAGAGDDVTFNPSSNTVAVVHASSPFVTVYPINNISGFGTKYSDPATTPGSTGSGVDFSPDGSSIAISCLNSPFIVVYPFSTSGFGTIYANHVSNYTTSISDAQDVAFHPSGNFISVTYVSSATSSTGIERTYGFASGSGFTSAFTDTYTEGVPTPMASNAGNGGDAFGVAVHPSGADVAFGVNGASPYVRVFGFNQSTGKFATSYTNATDVPATANRVDFSQDGNYLAAVHGTSPFITVWPWTSGTGFGTKISNPSTLPPNTGNGVAWGRV